MQMSCWFPAAGCTRVQASRCDAGVEKPRKPIKNPVSWPSSRLPHGGDEPPAETIRPVQAPPRWREPTHLLCSNLSLCSEQRGQTPPSLTLGGEKSDEGKIKLGAPPAWGRSDAAEQTNLSLHADLPLRSSPHVLGFKVEFVQLLRRRKKRKQTAAFRRLTAAIFRGCHP